MLPVCTVSPRWFSTAKRSTSTPRPGLRVARFSTGVTCARIVSPSFTLVDVERVEVAGEPGKQAHVAFADRAPMRRERAIDDEIFEVKAHGIRFAGE